MKQSTIKKYTDILLAAKNSQRTLVLYCLENGLNYGSISKAIYRLKKQNTSKSEDVQNLINLYNEIKDNEKTIEKIDTDDRSEISYIRDEDGKIKYYKYEIFRKNKNPLHGKLTREEMNTIYRLYSYYGDSLTQRVISRYFVDLSLIDFKRILRAFNITKASSPFAPHMFEEYSENELREIQLREKENSFLRKAEEDIIRNNERLLKKYAQENLELKNKLNNRQEIVDFLLKENISIKERININNISDLNELVIFLSDIHIGAYNKKEGYLLLPDYNEEEICRRLNKIIEGISSKKYNSITVCNLGDSVDSYNGETTRGGHFLPTILSNKEQSKLYQKVLLEFFNNLLNLSKEVRYFCVGESNHDGDWGWINNIVLSEKLNKYFGIKSYISDNPIDIFDINDVSIIYLHGKDNINQYKGFPLVLNDKTESWFNSYFIDCGYSFKKHKCVVKGDLHQYAYTCAKHFDYISVPSLYGSSNWIAANYGKTPWGILTMEIDKLNNIKTLIIKD